MTTATSTNPLQALLASSLVLWGVRGWVVRQGAQAAVIYLETGGHIRVTRLPPGDHPMRWKVEANGRARTCLSIVGALRAVREVLDITAESGLRLSPARS